MKTKEEAEEALQKLKVLGELQFGEKNHPWVRQIQITVEIIDNANDVLSKVLNLSTEKRYAFHFSFAGPSQTRFRPFISDKLEYRDMDHVLENIQKFFLEENDIAKIKLDYEFSQAKE